MKQRVQRVHKKKHRVSSLVN